MNHPTYHRPVKTSHGIILCRKNTTTNRPEVLLVHKRYTYAFAEFIHGRYYRSRIYDVYGRVSQLFDLMTREELTDILSLNFSQMWYRVWLSPGTTEQYNKKSAKFHATFIKNDNGATLRELVMNARTRGTLLWEVPKGHKEGVCEADSICAIRELYEETGVCKGGYKLLPKVKRRVSYISAGTRYNCAYYVAIANPNLSNRKITDPSRPTLRDVEYLSEVSEVKWFDIEHIRLVAGDNSSLERLVLPAFKLVKQYNRGRWDYRMDKYVTPSVYTPPVRQNAWQPAVSRRGRNRTVVVPKNKIRYRHNFSTDASRANKLNWRV